MPADYKFETKDDYPKYEKEVIEGVNWLIKTPVSQEQAKRKDINAFVMKWLSGSPTVHVEVSQKIVTFLASPDCLMIFLGSWAKYSMENQDFTDKVKGNMAGIEGVTEFYNLNKESLGKNKAIQKNVKLQQKGKLEDHIKAQI